MAPIITITLYGLVFWVLKVGASLEMSNELRLAFNIIGGIGALVLPIFVYSVIDTRLTRRAITLIGKEWCAENNVDFQKVEIYKNHFALIYKNSGRKLRKKFRVNFIFTTWRVKSIEWLEE